MAVDRKLYMKEYLKKYYLKHRVLKTGKRLSPQTPINCSECSVEFKRTSSRQKVCFSCKPKVDNKRRNAWFKLKYSTDESFRKSRQELTSKNRAIWLSKNIDKERRRKVIAQHKRRASGVLDKNIVQMVYEDNIKLYGTLTCILCLKSIEFGKDSLEHKNPICRGGDNSYSNLAVSHLDCNIRKSRRTVEEYQILIGVLN